MYIQDKSECSPFEPTDSITQGTIIKFMNKPEDETYGIIVTGDCDIEHDKFGDFLSYCNILPLRFYTENFYIPKTCREKIREKMKSIREALLKDLNVSDLSISAIDHIFSMSPTDLQNTIRDRKLINNINFLKTYKDKNDFSIEDFKNLGEKSFKNLIRFPGDKFYFTNLPDPETKSKGYVINLRRIKEIKKSQISLSFNEENPDCFAFAKLDSPYKQFMTQTLGAMFSDIGLPSEYENQRNETIELLAEELLK